MLGCMSGDIVFSAEELAELTCPPLPKCSYADVERSRVIVMSMALRLMFALLMKRQ
jgi:hypothetical protein